MVERMQGKNFAIEAWGLKKIYENKVYAIRDLNFRVEENEIYGFIGPNGAGKTTTLKIISGMLDPTEGKCKVFGKDVVKDKIAVKQEVGYLPEEDYLYGEMKLEEHLAYIAELYEVNDVKEAVDQVLQLTELEDLRKNLVKTLSKGQRRRAAIAKTLVHDPKVVILDELTSGLDPISSKHMLEMVRELKRKGKTVIFSTHTLGEAVELCDHVLILHHGRKLIEGTPEEIIEGTGSKSLNEAFFKIIGGVDKGC